MMAADVLGGAVVPPANATDGGEGADEFLELASDLDWLFLLAPSDDLEVRL